MKDVVLQIRRDALEPADRHRLGLEALAMPIAVRGPFFHSSATARRLARSVAGPPQDAGEDIRLPVDHEGVAVAPRRDQPDVFRNGGMGGARPLAIDDLVE